MSKSKIEWTEETINPTMGCEIISKGCENCYAMKMAYRLERMGVKGYEGTTRKLPSGRIIWSGRINFDISKMERAVASAKQPTVFFVDSMSDLFHDKVPKEFINKVFKIIYDHPEHTFQILTKRIRRMADYIKYTDIFPAFETAFPNVWLGTSIENKQELWRLDVLKQIPGAVIFLSLEPLIEDLGKIDLTGINLVIVGGESGSKARPMHPDWVRSIRDQCKAAKIPFNFKQWGLWWPGERGRLYKEKMIDFTDGQVMVKVGKKKSGRLLDGVLHNEFPEEVK